MRIFIVHIFLLTLISTCKGQANKVDTNFTSDFRRALNKNFSEKELDTMFNNYSALLTPHSDVTRLTEAIRGHEMAIFPLYDFKNEALYKDNIKALLDSKNKNQRLLAYLAIASSGDTTKENILLDKLNKEKDKACLRWAGMALMYLHCNNTTPIFDFLVANEDFGDAHMLPLFLELNKDSLQQTAYKRIHSKDMTAEILAVQILAYTPLNDKTESLIKEAVETWDIRIKGYAIYSLSALQIGHLLDILKPLLDSSETRRISLQALANSPTNEDEEYLYSLTKKEDTVSKELLDCFMESRNKDNLNYGLKLLYTKPIPKDYSELFSDNHFLCSDTMLDVVQFTLQKVTNPETLEFLVSVLKRRKDDKSTELLISFMSNKSLVVRESAAEALRGNKTEKLKTALPNLIKSPDLMVSPFTDLAIENNIDTLQTTYEYIYQRGEVNGNTELEGSAITYLGNYPRKNELGLFRNVLEKNCSDNLDYIKARYSSKALAKLNDTSSVGMIINACETERKNADDNCYWYMDDLAVLKGTKAKAEIQSFVKSKDTRVSAYATELLKSW